MNFATDIWIDIFKNFDRVTLNKLQQINGSWNELIHKYECLLPVWCARYFAITYDYAELCAENGSQRREAIKENVPQLSFCNCLDSFKESDIAIIKAQFMDLLNSNTGSFCLSDRIVIAVNVGEEKENGTETFDLKFGFSSACCCDLDSFKNILHVFVHLFRCHYRVFLMESIFPVQLLQTISDYLNIAAIRCSEFYVNDGVVNNAHMVELWNNLQKLLDGKIIAGTVSLPFNQFHLTAEDATVLSKSILYKVNSSIQFFDVRINGYRPNFNDVIQDFLDLKSPLVRGNRIRFRKTMETLRGLEWPLLCTDARLCDTPVEKTVEIFDFSKEETTFYAYSETSRFLFVNPLTKNKLMIEIFQSFNQIYGLSVCSITFTTIP